jgi:hypothetical protein
MFDVKIQRLNHDTRLWRVAEQTPHTLIRELLATRDLLLVLTYGRPPYKVVLGAPHQAVIGVSRICEQRRDEAGRIKARHADDNVASYALVAFSQLRVRDIPCKLVIMAHPTRHDPNKVAASPYCREIFSEQTELLFECHASGSSRQLELELSAGSNPLGQPLDFGRRLAASFEYRYSLGLQTSPKDNNALIIQPDGVTVGGKLQLPATKTISLIEAGRRNIPALHLEAKPRFRVPKNLTNSVSPDGLILGRAIAQTIQSF